MGLAPVSGPSCTRLGKGWGWGSWIRTGELWGWDGLQACPGFTMPAGSGLATLPSTPRLSLWCVWEGLEVQSPCSMVQTLTPWGRALPHFLSPALPFLELFRYRNFLLSSHLGPGHSLSPPRLDAQSSRHLYGSLSPIWRAMLEQRFPTALGTSSCPLPFFYLPAHEHPGFHACVCRPFVSPKEWCRDRPCTALAYTAVPAVPTHM